MNADAVQRWLEGHCQRQDDVAGGVVLSQNAAGELQLVADWPQAGPLSAGLTTVAREAVRRAKSLVLVPAVVQKEAGHARVVAVPLRRADLIVGAAALAVRSNDPNVAKVILEELERVAVSLAELPAAQAADTQVIVPQNLLKLQAIVADAENLPAAAQKLVNHLAREYQFDRVSAGLVNGGAMSIAAISSGAAVDDRQDLVRGIVDAMAEAADQDATVQYPGGLQETPRIVHAHLRLAARSGTALCTVPLMMGGHAKGALTFERKGSAPLSASDRDACEQVASVVAPVLELKRQADRPWWARATDGMRQSWQRRGQGARRLLIAGTALVVAILCFLPVTFNVGAPARVEGAIQRVLAAPMDGFLRQARVRPGDSVKQGDVLVELADQELLLEKRKWESEVTRHQNNFSLAMGRSDRGQFAINYARAAEARAQLDLVDQQLARAQVVAPMDALVIQGDLTQIIGAPVKRGDTLLTLAPADQYRIIVEVDERDIVYVKLGQRGRLALAALPGESLPFSVQRITPVASLTRDGRNVFEVEARLDAGSTVPRHGLQGVAKIEAGRHSLVWISVRRVADWLRLTIWSWLP
jgi:Barrel-sandwich domain of CusB or HlyD membrane-fusion/GAF domain